MACGAPRAEPAPAREQRKTLTILFCDVAGSTALGEQLDPEALRRVMRRYFDEMTAVVERHGGTVEKFIGDAVMAVFGIPLVREDDALRAVRAAAEIRTGCHRSPRSSASPSPSAPGSTPARSSSARARRSPPATR